MIESMPLFAAISIQTNQVCNLRCRFCFYGQYFSYGNDEIISTDVIRKIFTELVALGYKGRICLYNLNEPLTDRRIVDLLALAKSMLPDGVHFFSTNGTLLTQSLLDTILKYADVVRINRYDKIPELDLSHAKVDIRDKRNFFPYANSNRGGSLTGLPAASLSGKRACANPFGQLVIMPPGIAVLCCADGFKQIQLGDVRHESLEQIWRGRRFHTIRTYLASGRRSEIPLCKNCSIEGGGFYEYFVNPDHFDRIVATFKSTHGGTL